MDGYTRLYSDDANYCRICDTVLPAGESVDEHLRRVHPKDSIEAYHAAYPDAPLHATASPVMEPITGVSAEEAGGPGGQHAAVIKRDLPTEEQELYLQLVKDLERSEYPTGYLLASVAYYMVLAARIRSDLERLRRNSGYTIGVDDRIKNLDDLEKRIASGMGELEKQKREVDRQRREEEKLRRQHDPAAILEAQIAEAETWVQEHLGEFVSQCPNPDCTQMLSVPDLPHWAFAPAITTSGKEWMVWSQEAWSLVLSGTIPVWVMAYILRTSPEALRITAMRRGEIWPTVDIVEQETQLRKRLMADDVVMIKRARLPIQVMEELVEAGVIDPNAPPEPPEEDDRE